MIEINDREFELFQKFLQTKCGIHIPLEKRYLFNTRLAGLLAERQLTSFMELYNSLHHEEQWELAERLVEVMTTNETAFFRDKHPFTTLQQTLLPAWLEARQRQPACLPTRLRIWSAGCSTGQEAYSIAMLLCDWLKNTPELLPAAVNLLATDISAAVLSRARRGLYSTEEVSKGMPDDFGGRYLEEQTDGQWRISDEVRRMVTFRQMNLAGEFLPELINLDLILCRNVIIYFSDEVKKRVLENFYRILNPGGVLLIGSAENLYGVSDKFVCEHIGPTAVYRVVKDG